MMRFRFKCVGIVLAALLPAAASRAQIQVLNSLITTIAGHGTGCAGETDNLGDGCPSADSALSNPTGVAVDSAGNLYIADANDNIIRKVSAATGEITTVAGTVSASGFSGDTGPATSAELNNPNAVAVDAAGDLFIVDLGNVRIREVSAATGDINTIAGNGSKGYTGDHNPATSAEFSSPGGIAVNPAGTLVYIGDSGNHVVRLVNLTTGIITTYAGNGTIGTLDQGGNIGVGGPATSAELGSPNGVALDSQGNLYIADTYNSAIWKVTASTGTISVVVGNGHPNYGGDGGQATVATLYFPIGVTVASSGNLFIADTQNCIIREVNTATGIITTVAGNTQSAGGNCQNPNFTLAGVKDGGPATLAELYEPDGVAVDSKGNIYIADTQDNRIRKVAAANSLPQTNVGSASAAQNVPLYISNSLSISSITVAQSLGGLQEFTVGAISGCVADGVTQNGAGSICMVPITFHPGYPGLQEAPLEVVTSAGTFYFGLSGIGLGPQAALLPGVITTVAGTGVGGYTGDNGPATSATFYGVFDVAVDYAGNQYIDDYNNNVFRKVAAATGIVTTFAGSGTVGTSGDNGPATSAEFLLALAAGTDAAGNVYIADTNNNRIREVNAVTGIITTDVGVCCGVAGAFTTGASGYNGDGIPSDDAKLTLPYGVATDGAGNLYIADFGNNRIREVSAATGLISTVGGNGTGGYTGDNGPATSAELNSPDAIAVDSAGNIYFADSYNRVIRKITAATGIITTVAGDGTFGETGDNGPATSAELKMPTGVAVDAAGDLYITDLNTFNVRKVEAATGIITTVAGGGTGCTGQTDPVGDGCGATSANVGPQNLSVDGAGNLYIADSSNNRVRKVSLNTAPIIFPQTAVNSTSAAITFKVANIGNAPLSLSAITPSANFGVDSGTTTCSTSDAVPAGGSCEIGVVFSPTTGGASTGTLKLTDNALNVTGSTQVVTLNGSVGATSGPTTPTVTVSPSPTSITTAQSLTVTIAVSGTPTPTGSVVLSSGSYTSTAATLVSGSAMITVPAGSLATSTDTLTATYTPDSASSSTYNSATGTSTVTVTTPAKTTPTVTVSPSPTSITTAQSLTVTIAVSGTPTPTGSVVLSSGSYTSTAMTLVSGSAMITVPAGSLAASTDTLTATYTPDSNSSATYNSATGSNTVTVTTATVTLPTTAAGEWTWVGGSNTGNQPGVYGTLDTLAVGNVPGGRSGLSHWIDGSGNFWLFGGSGIDAGGNAGDLNDLWEYSASANEWAWVSGSSTASQPAVYGTLGTPAAGNVPGGRLSATSWIDQSSNLWLFGGFGGTGQLNDLWKFNPSTKQWAWEGGSSSSNQWGVYTDPVGTPSAVNVPGARAAGAQGWTDSNGNFWLFGGLALDSEGQLNLINDLWEFNPSTAKWTWMGGSKYGTQPGSYGTLGTPAAGNIPGAREGASIWTDSSGNVWLFGGLGFDSAGNEGSLNDLWELNPSTKEWTWIGGSSTITSGSLTGLPGIYGALGTAAAGNTPGGREFALSWTDSRGNFWLLGGQGSDATRTNGYLNDLWEFTPSTKEWTWMGGSSTVPAIDQGQPGVYGTLGTPAATNVPGGREQSAVWTDNNGHFWLFGGTGFASTGPNGSLNDLWEYQPSGTAAVATPTVTVTPSPTSITTAQSLTVTIGVSGNPTPTGSVTLSSGSYTSTATTLVSGSAMITVPAGSLATSTDTLTATYTPDSASSSTYNSATGTNTVTVTTPAKTTPTVTVAPSPASITTAQSLTVTIGVSGNPTPTGSVTLSSGSYTSTATTLVSGSAMITVPAGSLATGTDTLTVSYTPDSSSSSTYNSAIGTNTVTVTTPAKTTPAVTVSPSPTSITTTQSLTVTIGVSGTPTPTGSVTLSSGSYTSTATTLVSGSAMITVPAGSLATGTDTLTVSYTPDSSSSSTYNSATGTNTVTVTAATVQVTVGTSPAGLAFTVDGTSYTSAQTLSWTVGSSHTLVTTSPQTNGGTQNTFASWSDAGAISHSVTAPSTATSYTATFSTSYQLTTAANPSADGAVTPPSGTYYAAGTVVNLTATPNSGYSFTNWTGSVASTGSPSTTVTMSAAQSVTANFSALVVTAPVASLTPPSLSFTSTTSVASAAQVATLSNTGNATLTITSITIAGTNPTDFAVTTGANACGSSLAAGSSCSIYVTFTPASATSFAATLTVADNASGSPQTTTLTGTGTAAPSFVVSSTTTPQTVQPGGIATYSITATAQNGTFSNSVTLAASGLPAGATATFSPPSITPGSSSATSTLTIQTAKPVAALTPKGSPWPLTVPALAFIGFLFLPSKRRRRWITLAVLLLTSLGAFAALTACGGGFAMTSVTPATNYNITITGTSGSVVQTTTVQLTVE